MILNRIFGSKVIPSKGLYRIYCIVFLFSFYNMLIIAKAFENGDINTELTINMGCIVLAVLFLIHFIKVANEKSFLEYEYKILEKQTDMQYKFYLQQEKKHNKTVQVLHDVNKHVKAIEQLYSNGKIELANEYTGEITTILKPLIPVKYTGNPLLDIILTDKKLIAAEKGIDFKVNIDNVDLNFIEAIELTTIFGNLLDNAVEACDEVEDKKSIILKIQQFNEMVSISVKNTYKQVKWKDGLPISEKGSNRGIGLRNVRRCVDKYDGDISFKEKGNYFVVDMFLNS